MGFTSYSPVTPVSSLAATANISVGTSAGETVIATGVIPPGLAAGASFRLSCWCPFAVGGTAGSYTIKARVGGLTGNNIGSITTGSWTLNTTGELSLVAYVELITPGTSGSWQGAIVHSSLAGAVTNTATAGAVATADSTVNESFVITISLASATSTCGPSQAVFERVA